MGWLRQALSGPDNCTIAIGRLIGMAIAIVLLIGVPVAAAATIITGKVLVVTWTTFFPVLGGYVIMVTGAIGALIWGTNGTEPKPTDRDGHSDDRG